MWVLLAGLGLAGCFEINVSVPCGQGSQCEVGRICVEGRCVESPPSDDVGPPDQGHADGADVPPDEGAPPVDAAADAAALDLAVVPDVALDGPAPDARVEPDAAADAGADAAPDPDAAADMAPDGAPLEPEVCGNDVPFDRHGRPCTDGNTIAMWRFDDPAFPAESGFDPGSPPSVAESAQTEHLPDGGRFGGAVSFRGNEDQRINYRGLADVMPPFTIEAWVRPSQLAGARQAIVATMRQSGGVWNGGWEFSLVPDGNSFRLRLSWSNGTERNAASSYTSRRGVPRLTWSHVAVTVTADNVATLWVNGESEQRPMPIDIAAIGTQLGIGNRAHMFNGPFFGALDEIRLTFGVRPDEQIVRGANP